MDWRPATSADLAKVFRNLAPRMAAEYIAAGFNVRAAKQLFLVSIKAGLAHTLLEGGEPIAVIAWGVMNGVTETSFAAQERFFTPRSVRFARRHIREIQRIAGCHPVMSTSYSDRLDAGKWFRVLGFREIGRGMNYTQFALD